MPSNTARPIENNRIVGVIMSEQILKLKAKTTELADCWLWTKATDSSGYPITSSNGCKLVRRLMFELNGGTLAARVPIVTTCEERLCINPEHLMPSSIKKVAKKAAKNGAWTGLVRGAKISAKKRETSKINMDIARAIRFSAEPSRTVAAQYGIHKTLVQRIRNGTAWKDHTNPFAGLMA